MRFLLRIQKMSFLFFGVYLNDQAISYSFDFAVGAAEELDFTWRTGSITRANIAILIEI